MISVHFQGKSFYITIIQVYAPTSNAEEAEVEPFYEDLQDLHYRGLECKSKKSRNTWIRGKFGLGVQNEAGQRLTRVLPSERTGHNKHPLPTTQEKTLYMTTTRWPTLKSDGLYSLQPKMEKLYTVSKNKTGS